jgi:hypothetical protein
MRKQPWLHTALFDESSVCGRQAALHMLDTQGRRN